MKKITMKIQDDIKNSDEEMIEKFTVELSEESDEDLDEELTGVKIPKINKNKADWYDTNKFKIIPTTIDSNNFNHKNKIDKLKFNDITSLINNIKNNAISEADAKKRINELKEIRKAEIKNKRLINGQKKLLNLFDDSLRAIFNNNKNENDNGNVSANEDNNVSANEDNNVSVNKDNNVSMNENEKENESENENGGDQYYLINQLNNYFRTIDETKSFEEKIEILKKRNFLNEYWHVRYYHDNKKLNLIIFKSKAAYLLNDLDEQLFEGIFGQTLADKVINTTNKEENKIIIDDIKRIEIKFTNNMILVKIQSNQPIKVVIYSVLLKLF